MFPLTLGMMMYGLWNKKKNPLPSEPVPGDISENPFMPEEKAENKTYLLYGIVAILIVVAVFVVIKMKKK